MRSGDQDILLFDSKIEGITRAIRKSIWLSKEEATTVVVISLPDDSDFSSDECIALWDYGMLFELYLSGVIVEISPEIYEKSRNNPSKNKIKT